MLKYKLFCLFGLIATISVGNCKDSEATKFLKHLDVIPDVISEGPNDLLKVTYGSHIEADKGVELTPTQVQNQPMVEWSVEKNSYYTLLLVDPDAPSRSKPTLREFLHWLVVNIPENDLNKGEVIAEYIGAGPPKNTDLHRYIFLIYKQETRLNFTEPIILKTSNVNRPKFSTKDFVKKYNLGIPIAANFFQAQYDSYVDILAKQTS